MSIQIKSPNSCFVIKITYCPHCFSIFLLQIAKFIAMVQEQVFSSANLKSLKIILIYKAEHPSFFVNYRPISLLSNFSNFFKKVIYNHSVEFAKKYDKCFHCHFGFWKPLDIQNSDSSVNYLI